MSSQVGASEVADELGRRIAAGRYQPGALMPSVRKLAEEFEISKATAQVALSRLEAARFVVAERARGFVVQDVHSHGGFDVYGILFRLSMSDPEQAVATFTDIVDMERSVLFDVIGAYAQLPERVSTDRLTPVVNAMEELAQRDDVDLAEFLAREFDLLRRMALAAGQSAVLALLNSLAELIGGVPEAVDAYFVADPSGHVLFWRAIVNALSRPDLPHEAEYALVGDLLALYHQRVVTRFGTLVAPTHPRVAPAESA
ncbi:GntR family transcriptional regulator [Nocardia huaxiensis]|uniref:GntR family transcriptional regulator n=1 Tax=Nocardia huaxiensis TaxID=2755382 RepID=A0A7D6ZE80_9NOCA|nr:GntR family transcriptional regulator [Nocardia huaxiensis]QLY28047.1 GntR family transcriptional regulator [Nocardia huaxiensis]